MTSPASSEYRWARQVSAVLLIAVVVVIVVLDVIVDEYEVKPPVLVPLLHSRWLALGRPPSGAPLMPYRSPFITETDEPAFTDCQIALGLMLVADWTAGEAIHDRHGNTLDAAGLKRLRERIRVLSGDTEGGASLEDLARGIARRFPDLPPLPRTTAPVDPLRLSFDELWAKLAAGHCAVLDGNPSNVTDPSCPIRSMQAKDDYDHAVFVHTARGDRAFVMDPLGRGRYQGQWVAEGGPAAVRLPLHDVIGLPVLRGREAGSAVERRAATPPGARADPEPSHRGCHRQGRGHDRTGACASGCRPCHRRRASMSGADSRRANPWAEDLYRRARERGKSHPHAVRILARAWTHVIWHCWQDRVPYDPARHHALQRVTLAPAA